MSTGEGFKAHALAPLRQAEQLFQAKKLEDAFTAVGVLPLTGALAFAIDWVSVQTSIPRGRIQRRLPMSRLERAISQAANAQTQALSIVRQHSGGIAAFVGGFVGAFIDALTGVPLGGAISDWLGGAAQNARLKEPCRLLQAALNEYEAQVSASSYAIEQLILSNQQPRTVPLHFVAAAVVAGIAAAGIAAWALLSR